MSPPDPTGTQAMLASQLGVRDMFTLGIGPSSSHTVGPMKAGYHFASELRDRGIVPERIRVRLFGSLAATGIGHGTDRAVLLGLAGAQPETVEAQFVDGFLPAVVETGVLPLLGGHHVPFGRAADLQFHPRQRKDFHVNALTIEAWKHAGASELVDLTRTYYSVGGGFVLVEETAGEPPVPLREPASTGAVSEAGRDGLEMSALIPADGSTASPFVLPFSSGAELMERCAKSGASVAQVVRANEIGRRDAEDADGYLDVVTEAMFRCVKAGCETGGILPGGLGVPRRAEALRAKLEQSSGDPLALLDWVTLYALAVNEENAAGHRVVTAPTNGAAGIIPAVLGYYVISRASSLAGGLPALADQVTLWDLSSVLGLFPELRPGVRDFLLAATAVGSIIKTNASIAGAEVGCQGEVGSASAMAAAGLAQALGGTPKQVENAGEIAMEHSLGLTCDPVGGLVQIPCIERNAIGAVKAISAARMALYGDGRHQVPLDAAIETMRQTGVDMHSKYKETSVGGLAVNVVEC